VSECRCNIQLSNRAYTLGMLAAPSQHAHTLTLHATVLCNDSAIIGSELFWKYENPALPVVTPYSMAISEQPGRRPAMLRGLEDGSYSLGQPDARLQSIIHECELI
jgi:hypothetical protein